MRYYHFNKPIRCCSFKFTLKLPSFIPIAHFETKEHEIQHLTPKTELGSNEAHLIGHWRIDLTGLRLN